MNQYIYYVFQREYSQRHGELSARSDEERLAREMVLEGRARQRRMARRFHRPRLGLVRSISSEASST